jgi:ParB family chromosome partitioning protein
MVKKNNNNKGLGRGLSSLIADVSAISDTKASSSSGASISLGYRSEPLINIFPNPDQPRRTFSEEGLKELSNSIKEKGVVQPLIVRRRSNDDGFEIIAGERRWRAAQLAQLDTLPVIVKEFSDNEVLEIAIIENIQREELNPIEEARGYQQLMEKFGRTQEQVSSALGKSRSYIANLLRLLNLPDEVINYLVCGQISAGHAKVLVSTNKAIEISRLIIKDKLSVRETEELVRSFKQLDDEKHIKQPRKNILNQKDTDTKALEGDFSASLGVQVFIDHKAGSETGSIILKYKTLEEFDRLREVLVGAR